MLVVDRVELAVVDQVDDVRALDDGQCLRGASSVAMPSTNPLRSGDVREHVVGEEEVGACALGAQRRAPAPR